MHLLPETSTNHIQNGKSHRYFSIVENQRVSAGQTVQRTVLPLGEINDQQQAVVLDELARVLVSDEFSERALFGGKRSGWITMRFYSNQRRYNMLYNPSQLLWHSPRGRGSSRLLNMNNHQRAVSFGLSLAALALCGAMRLEASLITVSFTANLAFNPTAIVPGSGASAADVIGPILGPGSGGPGTAQIRGSLTYQSNTPSYQHVSVPPSGSVADYLTSITAAQLAFGSSTVNANIPLINSSSSSGAFAAGIGPMTACFGATMFVSAFCPAGLTANPTNAAAVFDHISITTTLPDGSMVTRNSDSLALYIGGTAGSLEFSPTLSTGTAGPVDAKSVFVGLCSGPARQEGREVSPVGHRMDVFLRKRAR